MTELAKLDKVKRDESIATLKKQLQQLPQITIETKHLIHGGMYGRTVFIPAGSTVTGAKTNIDNICTVSGDITVSTDKGVVRLTGYNVIPANSGYSRAVYAHADTYWTTFLVTDSDNVQAIEEAMTDAAATLQTRKTGLCGNSNKQLQDQYGIY